MVMPDKVFGPLTTAAGRRHLRLPLWLLGRQLGRRQGLGREVALADSLHAEGAWRALPASSTHSRRRL